MTLKNIRPPFARSEYSVPAMMNTAVLALCVLLVLPVIRFGLRPLVLAIAAVLTCLLCDILFCLVRGETIAANEASGVVTGLVVTMLTPVTAPLWLPCTASAFAVLVAKRPFGPFGRNPFNPAAAGVAFASLCWPKLMFSYLDPTKPWKLPVFGDALYTQAESSAAILKSGLKPVTFPLDLLWGNVPGPIGTTAMLVVAAGGLLLFFRRAARWESTVCFLAAAALFAALFPRIACSTLTSVKYELLSGSLMFCAVYMVTDPVTSPRSAAGRCIYGTIAGALTMLFRYYGAFEQGAVFAVLLANACSPVIGEGICRIREWRGRLHG